MRIRPRITYANVTATLALVVALGGTSYAAVTIGGENVRDGSLTGADLRNGSVGPADLAANHLKAAAAKKKAKAGRPGPQGVAGPQGAQGAQGVPGIPGTAPACQGNGSGDTMVSAGAVCIDRYEVSVWSSPTGGTQYGATSDDYPAACTDTGQNCDAGSAGEIYARSIPGVTPSSFLTYFQAQQALANSGKRFPSNAEWQQAVAGTPDSTTCNVSTSVVADAGANAGCISNHGANDMVGNLDELVGDWVPASTSCPTYGDFSDDQMCLAGASTAFGSGPGVLVRGGDFIAGDNAGPFSIIGSIRPSSPNTTGFVGFRGAR